MAGWQVSGVFFIAMLACWVAWGYIPPADLIAVSAISVLIFFYGGLAMSKGWSRTKEKTFIKNVFIAGFSVRLLWVLYCFFIFNPEYYGNTFGDTADTEWLPRMMLNAKRVNSTTTIVYNYWSGKGV